MNPIQYLVSTLTFIAPIRMISSFVTYVHLFFHLNLLYCLTVKKTDLEKKKTVGLKSNSEGGDSC